MQEVEELEAEILSVLAYEGIRSLEIIREVIEGCFDSKSSGKYRK